MEERPRPFPSSDSSWHVMFKYLECKQSTFCTTGQSIPDAKNNCHCFACILLPFSGKSRRILQKYKNTTVSGYIWISSLKQCKENLGLILERLNKNRQVETGQIFPSGFRVTGPEPVSVVPVNIAFGKVVVVFFLITIFLQLETAVTLIYSERYNFTICCHK